MKLIFKYDLEQDISNYKRIASSVSPSRQTSAVLEKYYEKFGQDVNENNLKYFIKEFVEEHQIDFAKKVFEFRKEWESVSAEFDLRMKGVFEATKLPSPINVFLATSDKCSYSIQDNLFFVFVLADFPKKVIMHELFHFYTYYAFRQEFESEELASNKKAAYLLKEAMIEILDIECLDLMGKKNQIYKQQEDLRKLCGELWLEEKNIKKVFEQLKAYILSLC